VVRSSVTKQLKIESENMILHGKICVIAGAARAKGIGHATARLFAEHGAKLVLADRYANDDTAANLISDLAMNGFPAPDVIAVKCDITSPNDCAHLVEASIARFGQIDVLVNSAGIVESKGLLDIGSDGFDQMIDVNLKGAFNLCQAALRAFTLQKHGVIVNLASLAAQRGGGLVGGAHYASAKGGVLSLTRTIAREFGPQGIRANIICPAMAQTSMIDGVTDAQIDAILRDIPLRRLGTPREIAGACLFLASDLSSFVTGATIDVNGGLHIH
jgi:NAD(P)-dependent dehydrogenase (short-subunit alcohol dehydrogenase family)